MNVEPTQVPTKPASSAGKAKRLGRPCKHNWEAERQRIEMLINLGYSLHSLASSYGITQVGMLKVLRRLGLATEHSRPRKGVKLG